MLAVSPENKRRRQQSLERKASEKNRRPNPYARELRSPRFNQKTVNTNQKGGSNNLLRHIIYEEDTN